MVATHQYPDTETKFVRRIAKKLTAILACYLAGEVASILSPVAAIEHREMVAPMYQPLLTPVYLVRPIYMELLHASSRLRKDTRVETARPSNGLVKRLDPQRKKKIQITLEKKLFCPQKKIIPQSKRGRGFHLGPWKKINRRRCHTD